MGRTVETLATLIAVAGMVALIAVLGMEAAAMRGMPMLETQTQETMGMRTPEMTTAIPVTTATLASQWTR